LFLWLFFQGGAAAAGEQWRQRRDNVIATGGTSRLWHGGLGVNEKQPKTNQKMIQELIFIG